MDYPIVIVKTRDGLDLHGMILEAPKSKTILINVHGTASNFYEQDYQNLESEMLLKRGISVLWANNRGAAALQAYQLSGAATEKFEDCLLDLNAWSEFALKLGYENFILQGHSLGTEKIIYYVNKGKYRSRVRALILLGPADSYGTQMKYAGNRAVKFMSEAKSLLKKGNGEFFLTSDWLSHAGILPKNADSYVNFFSEGSELSKTLPLRNAKRLDMFRKIPVPILAVIGDLREFTVIPITAALDLMKAENPRAECYQVRNCGHDFIGKEKELTNILASFVDKIL